MDGVIVVSIYLVTGQGLKAENSTLLEEIGKVLKALGRPFIVAGDFQMGPEALKESGWLEAVDAQVFAPRASTCVSSRSAAVIDFYVGSTSIVGLVVGVATLSHVTEIRPHKPARIIFEGALKDEWMRVVQRPKAFPTETPYGPAPWSDPSAWEEVRVAFDQVAEGGDVNVAYTRMMDAAEAEVADAFGIVEGRARYLGRGRGAKVAWQKRIAEKTFHRRGLVPLYASHWEAELTVRATARRGCQSNCISLASLDRPVHASCSPERAITQAKGAWNYAHYRYGNARQRSTCSKSRHKVVGEGAVRGESH